MVSNVIERYLYDMLNARSMLLDHRCSERHSMAHGIIGDVLNYFVDHLEDVAAARCCLAVQGGPESLQMLDLLDEFMSSHAQAYQQSNAALKRAISDDPCHR